MAGWWNGRHAALRRLCRPWREGSSPSLATFPGSSNGRTAALTPSRRAGIGSTPAPGACSISSECGGGTPPCEGGGHAGSTPAGDTVHLADYHGVRETRLRLARRCRILAFTPIPKLSLGTRVDQRSAVIHHDSLGGNRCEGCSLARAHAAPARSDAGRFACACRATHH